MKKAMESWQGAEAAGDPFAPILVADQLFSDMTCGGKPGSRTVRGPGPARNAPPPPGAIICIGRISASGTYSPKGTRWNLS